MTDARLSHDGRSITVRVPTAFFKRGGRKLLETGVFDTVEEIAAAEKINASYVSRVLRLTLLAPDIVEAILNGRQPPEMTLAVLMRPFAVVWEEQKAVGLGSGG